jgi:hypothetical protein
LTPEIGTRDESGAVPVCNREGRIVKSGETIAIYASRNIWFGQVAGERCILLTREKLPADLKNHFPEM